MQVSQPLRSIAAKAIAPYDAILVLVANYLKAGYSPEEAETMAYAELEAVSAALVRK